jgi:peptide/nickel transport system substrate-binding protein
MKYCNPEVDKLLNEARQSTDNGVRKQKYDAANAILSKDLPIIYFGHQSWIWGYKKSVTGFTPVPDGMIRLVGVKKEG